MAELPPARVVEFLGGIPPGEVSCLLARVGPADRSHHICCL